MHPHEQVILVFAKDQDIGSGIAGVDVPSKRYDLAADRVSLPNFAVHVLKVVQQGEAHVAIHHDQVGSPF